MNLFKRRRLWREVKDLTEEAKALKVETIYESLSDGFNRQLFISHYGELVFARWPRGSKLRWYDLHNVSGKSDVQVLEFAKLGLTRQLIKQRIRLASS